MGLVTQAYLQTVLIENMARSWVNGLSVSGGGEVKVSIRRLRGIHVFLPCGSFLPAFCCWMCTIDEHWQGLYSKPSPSTMTNRSCHPQPILPTKMLWRSNQESIQNKHGMPQYEQQQQQQQQWHDPHQQRTSKQWPGGHIIREPPVAFCMKKRRTTPMTPWRTNIGAPPPRSTTTTDITRVVGCHPSWWVRCWLLLLSLTVDCCSCHRRLIVAFGFDSSSMLIVIFSSPVGRLMARSLHCQCCYRCPHHHHHTAIALHCVVLFCAAKYSNALPPLLILLPLPPSPSLH